VEEHLCKAWQNGWCLVDGTLIPLFAQPYWFGESYFDRKCCYSLNMQARHPFRLHLNFTDECRAQIVSLPNLRIVDFSYGHTGSTHDSTAWEETQVLVNMNNTSTTASGCGLILLTQYASLLSTPSPFMTILQISEWVVAPYKKPECDMPDNEVFNNHVSRV
jgi:hypothetical protein